MTENEFIKELEKLNIVVSDTQTNQLKQYYELLVMWNEKMNLTGITDKKEVYLKHFYDSLTISKVIDLKKEKTLCDIGTGAGFPGLVLKIIYPHLNITLVDALNKRINFLNEVIKKLKLDKIETVHARIEEYGIKNRELFDVVVARAVAPLNVLLEYAIPVTKTNKYFIAMKGSTDELSISQHALEELSTKTVENIKFLLPYEESSRTILKFQKLGNTSKKYPRKNVDIKKKPL